MVRRVLLDVDGVLQRHPVGWVVAAASYVGDDAPAFFADVTGQERGLLTGGDGFPAVLAAVLERYGVAAPADDVYRDVWPRIEPVAETVALVHRLRALGLGVHLATNQQAGRAAHMRAGLGYDDLFDESFYSCELGVAKPDPPSSGPPWTGSVRPSGSPPTASSSDPSPPASFAAIRRRANPLPDGGGLGRVRA